MQSTKKPLYLQTDYIDKKIEISFRWLNGKPEHDKIYNECCHDFSCCVPELFTENFEDRLKIHTNFCDKLLERRRSQEKI